MCLLTISVSVLVIFGAIGASVVDPNPRGGDPGKALYLTKYIENGEIAKARDLSLVTHPEILIPSHAGYLTVDKKYNSTLFFWFFPAKTNPNGAPVLLWLQGGPGISSLIGLFSEHGPYSISKALKLIPRQYSWHLNHNIIYIDNPVGAGFSFTDSDSGYANNEKDPNEFFVSGESYAGKYVPALGHAIHEDSKRTESNAKKPIINLKGLTIGNGRTDPIHQSNYGDYLYHLGLIDSNERDEFTKQQNQAVKCMEKNDFKCAFDIIDKLIGGKEYKQGTLFQNLTGFKSSFNYLKPNGSHSMKLGNFLRLAEVRRAIHVGSNAFHRIHTDPKVQTYLRDDIFDSVADWVAELLSHYPILVYNGQLDILVAYPLTENYLRNLNFNGADEYKIAKRHIWRVDKEIAGYVKKAGNLTEVFVRNAGHMVPKDQPKWAFDLIYRFTHHKGFF